MTMMTMMTEELVTIPAADYHAAAGYGSTQVKAAAKSIGHLLSLRSLDSAAVIIGSAVHDLVLLGPEAFQAQWKVLPPMIKTRNCAAYKNIMEGKDKRQALLAEESVRVAAMAVSVLSHEVAGKIILAARERGRTEVSTWWTEQDVLCKARADVLEEDMVWDLKTTSEDAMADRFSRAIAHFDYHIQAAHYLPGFQPHLSPWQYGGAPWGWIVVESLPPHNTSVFQLDSESLAIGQQERRTALERIRKYQADPAKSTYGYRPHIEMVGLPQWKKR